MKIKKGTKKQKGPKIKQKIAKLKKKSKETQLNGKNVKKKSDKNKIK